MFNIVLEKLNVVGVIYTYDQIILTAMDWLLCAFHNFSDHLFLIIREPGYWYQQPLSDYKKCQIAVCSSVAYGTHWDPQWQPDTTGVVITPLQQIHIDNRGQPACRSLMGLGWGCPIDWKGIIALIQAHGNLYGIFMPVHAIAQFCKVIQRSRM